MTKNYIDFRSARSFATNLGLSSEREWREYCKSSEKPKDIPSVPNWTYRENGWLGWGDWLGTGRIKYGGKKYLSFNEAWNRIAPIIAKNAIDTQEKWYANYRKLFSNSERIPIAVDNYYKGKGWISWRHWLRSETRKAKRKTYFKEKFFQTWSSDMAYILGFWFADGNIFKNTFTICQHKKDRYILEKFMRKLEYTGTLKKYKNCYIFPIYSKDVVNDIKNLGGKEKKSLDISFPLIPDEYLGDFVRGYFDGDGTVVYDKKNDRYVCSFVSGSKQFISGLYMSLKRFIPMLRGSIYKENKNCYRLKFSSHDTIRLREFIYKSENELRLLRKHEKMLLAERKYKEWNSRL